MAKKLLTRRAFLVRALGAFVILAVMPYAAYKWLFGKPADIVLSILKRRVGYLKVEDGVFEKFADEYVEYKSSYRGKLEKVSLISVPYAYVSAYQFLPMGHPLRRMEDNVVTKFLMSTDFFARGADESRTLRYLSFYDPRSAPCRNPLAMLRR